MKKSNIWIVLLCYLTLFLSHNLYAQCKLDKSNYNLVFAEEFNSQSNISTLSSNWHFVPTNTLGEPLPGNMHSPDDQVLYKQDNLDLISNPGNLSIKIKKLASPYYINVNGENKLISYESGWLESKMYYDPYCSWQHNGFAYGMFEARIKLPAGYIWPAFWLTDHCVTEIDIVEAGDFPQADYYKYSTNNVIYWPGCGNPNPKKSCQQIWNYGIDLSADFHTYTCVWTPNEVSFFFDGKLMRTVSTNAVKTVQCPASIILGSGAFIKANPILENQRVPIGSEYNMLVDYVRVYKPKNLDYSQSYFLNEPQFAYTDITKEANLQSVSSKKPNFLYGVKILPNPLNDKEVFYCGQDNRIYIATDLNGHWEINSLNCINGTYPNVAGPINFSKIHNTIYYIGNDNKVYSLRRSGILNQFVYSVVSQANDLANTQTNFAVADNGEIFYRGQSNKIYWYKKITTAQPEYWERRIIENSDPNSLVGGDIVVNSSNNANDLFYRGADGRLQNYYKTSSTSYGHAWIDNNFSLGDKLVAQKPGIIKYSKALNGVFYIGSDGYIKSFRYFNGTWNYSYILPSPINSNTVPHTFVSTLGWSEINKQIFYVGGDGRIQEFYLNSLQNWTNTWLDNQPARKTFTTTATFYSTSMITDDAANTGIYFISENGNLCRYKFEYCEKMNKECNIDVNYLMSEKTKTNNHIPHQNKESKISVYPNPFSSGITINNSKHENFTIIDVNGKVQKNGKIPASQQINLHNLNDGIYLLILDNEFGTEKIKILKNSQ